MQTCHAKPKTQSTGAGRHQLLPVGGMLTARSYSKDSLRKVRTLWHCSRLRSVALYLWLIVADIRRNRPPQQYPAHCRVLVKGTFAGAQGRIRFDCKIPKRRSWNGQRDWCGLRKSHRDYLRSGYLTIVCLSWAVNHYRDNAITYKAQRDKNAREPKLANAAITDMQMRQRDVAALDAKYTKELADAKAENDALRDDAAAGRRPHDQSSPVGLCG